MLDCIVVGWVRADSSRVASTYDLLHFGKPSPPVAYFSLTAMRNYFAGWFACIDSLRIFYVTPVARLKLSGWLLLCQNGTVAGFRAVAALAVAMPL